MPWGASAAQSLFSHSQLISARSPYFKAALAEGFRVDEVKPQARPDDGVDWLDSDDEEQAALPDVAPRADSSSARAATSEPLRRIVIRDFAPDTVRAYLGFLLSGHIEFAPLSSLSHAARAAALRDHAETFPDRLRPVSAKSIYRMADKCVDRRASALTAQNGLPAAR